MEVVVAKDVFPRNIYHTCKGTIVYTDPSPCASSSLSKFGDPAVSQTFYERQWLAEAALWIRWNTRLEIQTPCDTADMDATRNAILMAAILQVDHKNKPFIWQVGGMDISGTISSDEPRDLFTRTLNVVQISRESALGANTMRSLRAEE